MTTNTDNRKPEPDASFEEIARDILRINTLEALHSDATDNHVVSVCAVREALRRAYDLGCRHMAAAARE